MLKINRANLDAFYALAERKLERGVDRAVEEVKAIVPVDTGRLQESVRRGESFATAERSTVGLLLGGIAIPGIYREQTFSREVDYALPVEVRNPRIRSSIGAIATAVVDGMREDA